MNFPVTGFYNASMRGMVPEEMYFYLKKYLRNEKLVLIGFDFYMFNERELPLVRISDWNDLRYTKVEVPAGCANRQRFMEDPENEVQQ